MVEVEDKAKSYVIREGSFNLYENFLYFEQNYFKYSAQNTSQFFVNFSKQKIKYT